MRKKTAARPCRYCGRDIRWMKDDANPKGVPCYDCLAKKRGERRALVLK